LKAKTQHYKNVLGSLPPNKEAKRELNVKYHNETLPFCSEPKYLGVTLYRSLTHRRHLQSISKLCQSLYTFKVTPDFIQLRNKLTSHVALLRQLAGSGWGAGAITLRTATLAFHRRVLCTRADWMVDFSYPILPCFCKMISVSDPNPVLVEIILSVSENYPKVYCVAQHTFLCCVYFSLLGKIDTAQNKHSTKTAGAVFAFS